MYCLSYTLVVYFKWITNGGCGYTLMLKKKRHLYSIKRIYLICFAFYNQKAVISVVTFCFWWGNTHLNLYFRLLILFLLDQPRKNMQATFTFQTQVQGKNPSRSSPSTVSTPPFPSTSADHAFIYFFSSSIFTHVTMFWSAALPRKVVAKHPLTPGFSWCGVYWMT